MTAPTTYSGDTWGKVAGDLFYAHDAANGRIVVGGEAFPRLNNAEALAILQAFRKMGAAWKIKAPLWPDLWYAALGYWQTGDKFQISHDHARAEAPPELIEGVWKFVNRMGEELNAKRAQPVLLVLDRSWTAYEKAAAEAWSQLKRDRAATGKRLPMPPIPDKNPLPVPPVPKLPSGRGIGILLILVAAAFLVKDR